MSSCPTCNREYSDETMRFCLDDGTPLVVQTGSARGADATWQLPDPLDPPATIRSTQPPGEARSTIPPLDASELPQTTAPTASKPAARRSSALLLVLGAVVLGLVAVAVAFIATRNGGQDPNANQLASASPGPSVDSFSGAASTTVPNSNGTTETKSTTPKESSTASQKDESPTATQPPVRKEITVYVPPEASKPTPIEPPTKTNEPPAAERPKLPRNPISAGVINGKATRLVKPAYPPAAKAARASGTVQVQVTVDEDGNVISASAVSGHPLLRQSAVAAARASKFSPIRLSGQPVKYTGVIYYNFVPE